MMKKKEYRKTKATSEIKWFFIFFSKFNRRRREIKREKNEK